MAERYKAIDESQDDGYPTRPGLKRRVRKTLVRTARAALGQSIFLGASTWGGWLKLRRIGHSYPALQPSTFQPRRILVIRLDLIGDLVMSMVLVRVLKRTYPEAEIDLVAVPASAKVIAGDPDLAQIIGYDPNIWRRPQALLQKQNWRALRQLLGTLQARDYDLAISVFGKWAGTMAVLSKARRTLGFGRESFPGFMTDSVAGQHWEKGARKHEVDYCLELARAAGASLEDADRYAHLFIPEQATREVEELLSREGVEAGQMLVACHVSANNGQSKRWPVPYWATLLDTLIREDRVKVILTGAPNDLPLIEKITRRMQEQPLNLAGHTSLTQLAALLKRVDLLISGDSGPVHMAGAVDTPLIALHGPTDPQLSGPVSRYATIVQDDIWCSPCYEARETADCRFFTTQCMKNIRPERVLAITRAHLSQHSQISGQS